MKKKILSAVLACAATMSLTTCAFADAPATADPGATAPGASDEKVIVATVDLGEIDSKGIEGDKLNEKIFTGDLKDLTWKDVTSVEFTSADGLFGVQFSVKAGAIKDDAEGTWFKMGVNELAKAEETGEFRSAWTLGEAEIKAIVDAGKPGDGFVKLITEDGNTATVTAKVTAKKAAEPVDPNKPTGIALAVAPAALAVAFVSVAAVMSKKKKG